MRGSTVHVAVSKRLRELYHLALLKLPLDTLMSLDGVL